MNSNYISLGSNSVSYNTWESKPWDSSYSWQKERARFQQKQWQEKEEKLLKLYEEQQKRALKSVGNHRGRSLASSNSSAVGVGKVRYLFQSRRTASEAKPTAAITGRDKSYPLEPLTKYLGARNVDSDRRINRQTDYWDPQQRSISLDRYNSNVFDGNDYFSEPKSHHNSDNVKVEKIQKNNSGLGRSNSQKSNFSVYRRTKSPNNWRNSDEISSIYSSESSESDLFKSRNGYISKSILDNHLVTQSNVEKLPSENRFKTESSAYPFGTQSKLFNINLAGCDSNINKMDRKFRNYVSQSTLSKKPEGAKSEGKESASSGFGSSNSPIRKIRKPTPVPLSVAPTHLIQKGMKSTARTESIPENPLLRLSQNTRTSTSPKKFTTVSNRQPSTESSSTPASKATVSGDLANCKICGRHFALDRISKHEEVCQKSKKRKPFDALGQRVKGTEVEKYIRKSSKGVRSQPEKTQKVQNNWRKKHEEFIQNIRAAKEVTAHLKKGGKLSDLPPPPPSDYSDYIQCPHCLRKFCSAAADRHIPKCANIINNKPKSGLQKNAALKQGSKLLHSATSTVRSRK